VVCALLGIEGWVAWRTWPRTLTIHPAAELPRIRIEGRRLLVVAASDAVLGQVARYHDELTAFLYFEYLRSLKQVESAHVLLTSSETPEGPVYRILLQVSQNLLEAVPYLAQLQAEGFISEFAFDYVPALQLDYARQQTRLFESAYNLPVRRKLESLNPAELQSSMARFILFKSKTDRRVRERIEPVPAPLSLSQASRLAADIITVARFYDLPLAFFLGIGAMENNYMNVPGDLAHMVWKRRTQPGDIIIKRRRRRVLVWNYSLGPWQITRETLRYAHRLFLKDKRDYNALPPRLRLPRVLNFEHVTPDVLTTYAGLLFRDLLDKFHGDVEKAVGAYNGGVRNPNLKYAAGVQAAADYARKILEAAAALNGHQVAQTQFITARHPRPFARP
jgi:hypothetical protein